MLLGIFLKPNAWCQDTKFVLKRSNEFTEEYYVLRDNKTIRHGTYVKYKEKLLKIVGDDLILETGTYDNGLKTGEWRTYFNFQNLARLNKVQARGTFVNGKKNGLWYYYHLDTAQRQIVYEDVLTDGKSKKVESVNVTLEDGNLKLRQVGMFLNDKRKGEWISFDTEGEIVQQFNFSSFQLTIEKSAKDSTLFGPTRQPIYLGGSVSLSNHMMAQFDVYRGITTLSVDSLSTLLNVSVDESGSVTSVSVAESSNHKPFDKECLRLAETTDGNWIPAIEDHVPTKGLILLRFELVVEETKESFQIWRSRIVVE